MALIGPLRGRDPGGHRDALAAVGADDRPALDALPAGAHRRPARLPRHRCAARGHRVGRRARGARRGGAGVARRGGGLPGARRGRRLAGRAARPRRRRAAGERAAFLVALGIGLHNLGEGLAIGSAYASARWRWAPRWSSASRSTTPPRGSRSSRRWRARVAPRRAGSWRCSACSRGAGDPRRLDRRLRLPPEPGRVHVRRRRGRDRPGRRPDRPVDARRRRPACSTRSASAALRAGLAVMYVTGLLVCV